MLIVAALGASGLYGWQRWQQQQRLWQTAIQVRDYLLQPREDALTGVTAITSSA